MTPDAPDDHADPTDSDTADAPDDAGDSSDSSDSPTDAAYYRAEADAAERIPADAPKQTWLWVVLSRWLLDLEAWLRSHGGRPLRLGLRAFWGLVAVAGLILLFGPVINPPLTLDDITQSASSVTDRWIAREFAVNYEVTRTPQGTLAAHVTENISANFPDGVDESGIQRVLATEYQSHALNPSNISATLDGTPVDVGTSRSADEETLTIGGPQTLQGDHVFVLQYDLENLAYSTTNDTTGQNVDLLEWNVFGPSWPQGLAGLDVTVTLPKDLDDRLVGQPRGSLAWTLLSSGEWLTPEPGGPSDVVSYRFTNDQNIPPHAEAWFTMDFEPGTFTMPAPTALYWLQVYGPLAPLGFLVLTLLLAFAARAVAWSDARGRPWFVSQSDPPKDITARVAAQVLRAPLAMELAEALETAQAGSRGRIAKAKQHDRLVAAAKVAQRTGRIGDRPRALSRYLTAAERRGQLTDGLRRIPRGFVRDLFIAAPIALTIVQWGLVRQLSYQAKLSVVWWPVAFVIVSSVIALIVLAIALSARPLTRRGALVKQYLLGIGVYADRTQLLDRSATSEKVLPYAVLLAPAREAGEKTVAVIEGELGEAGVSGSWRTSAFLTWPRLVIRSLSVLVVIGAILAAALLPNPFPRSEDYVSYSGDVPGTLDTKVTAMDARATLSRTADRRAHVDVTENLTVSFTDSTSQPPQFAQEWPSELDGQSLGLVVSSVTLDGAPIAYVAEQQHDTLLLRTTLADVVTGTHAVQVTYALESAAVAAVGAVGAVGASGSAGDGGGSSGGVVDRVRWAALLDGWQYDSQWGDDPPTDPLSIRFTLSDELAGLATQAGWITLDTSADNVDDWTPSVVPFGGVADAIASPGSTPATTESSGQTSAETSAQSSGQSSGQSSAATSGQTSGAGDAMGAATSGQSHTLNLAEDPRGGGWPFELTVDDVGASVDFPAGTFAGPSVQAMQAAQFAAVLPLIMILVLAAIGFVLGALGVVLGAARRRRVFAPGPLRDGVWWLAPGVSVATIILFVWSTLDMPADDQRFVPIALSTVAAVLVSVAALILTRRSRILKAKGRSRESLAP